MWDPAVFDGGTHVSAAEREALERLRVGVGGSSLTDLLPRASYKTDDPRHPFTFWEMRTLGFQKGRGMRLDLALVNPALAERVGDVWVDRDARAGTRRPTTRPSSSTCTWVERIRPASARWPRRVLLGLLHLGDTASALQASLSR